MIVFKRMQRPIAATVLLAFTSLTLQPLSVIAQDRPAPRAAAARVESGEEKFSRTLNEFHEILKELAPQAAMPHMVPAKPGEKDLRAIGPNMRIEVERAKPLPGVDPGKKVGELRAKVKELLSLEGEVHKSFAATEKHVKDKNLPSEILARHEAAMRTYASRSAEFKLLAGALNATGPALETALANLAAFMAKYPNEKTHTPSDPNNLPWGSPKPVKRAPYTTAEQFKTSGLFDALYQARFAKELKKRPVRLAQSGSLSGIGLPSTNLPATPEPADLAETEDVLITQAIRDLAVSLGNNPVRIHNWVRNNVSFVPSYGSIQGSDMTLQTKRGNAFDTASLLIALLRAAGIAARYVYGTVEIPADKVMNWVGGVTVPVAAQNLMGQGGIPNIGIAEAGRVQWIQLEHVWVEAYIDYVPSRGAVHRAGDTWVPLDASFKQYAFTSGMNIGTNMPFDVQGFLSQMQQGATVNEQEGWIQGINQTPLRQALEGYQSRITDHINAQNPNPALGDVIGRQRIVQDNAKILYGTLPYKAIAVGSKFQAVPDRLRWKFRYNVYAGNFERAMDNPFIGITRSTPAIAGRKITLSYRPSTQSDIDTLNSLLPQPHADGSPIELHELPQNLPGYLVSLIPEFRIDGLVAASGPGFRMGQQLIQNGAYFNPVSNQWEGIEDNTIVVGEYLATALDLQGTSPVAQLAVRDRLQRTQAAVDDGSASQLTAEDLAGDVLYSNALSYFAAIDTAAYLNARDARIVTFRMPSYGNFGLLSKTSYIFGIPRTVSLPGMQMDVDRILSIDTSSDGGAQALVAFRRATGLHYSALEHMVPERAFRQGGSSASPQGISAVKAIGIALAQGQRVFVLTAQNREHHASALAQVTADAAAKNEIQQALGAGKEVTFHQTPISLNGMNGYGYIIVDPETGAGAYKISGGANGAVMLLFAAGFLAILALFSAAAIVALVGAIGTAVAMGAVLPALILMAGALYIILNDPEEQSLQSFLVSWAFWRLVALYVLLPLFFPFLGGVALLFGALAMLVLSLILAELTSYFLRPNGPRWVRIWIRNRDAPLAI